MRKADVIFLRVAGLVWQLLLCTSSFALFPANDHRGHRGQRLCRRTGPCLADLTSSARPAALFIFLTSPSGRSCMTSMDTRGYRDVELTRPGAHSHRVAEPESTARHPVWTSEKDIWPLGRKHRAHSAQRKVVWQKQPTNTLPHRLPSGIWARGRFWECHHSGTSVVMVREGNPGPVTPQVGDLRQALNSSLRLGSLTCEMGQMCCLIGLGVTTA